MLSKLKESNICVETQDKAKGVIVARCLTLVMNLILWRVWGDKLLFQLTKIGPTTTQVKASAVPNLLRYKVGKNEKTADLRKLISQIFG